MHHPGNPATQPPAPDHHDRYSQLVAAEADRLDEQLANVRRDLDAGDITVREAADERVTILTEHLNRLRLLRAEYHPGG